jgi:singapore isolate B (sub-type 7) whole genome shotgun sequence assembly, scaffold_9
VETVEDSGWKLIHGDVFRPPRDSDLFATVVGTGVQVFWTLITVIVLAAAGILSPAYRGSILTSAVILFVLMGFLAGFSSARL